MEQPYYVTLPNDRMSSSPSTKRQLLRKLNQGGKIPDQYIIALAVAVIIVIVIIVFWSFLLANIKVWRERVIFEQKTKYSQRRYSALLENKSTNGSKLPNSVSRFMDDRDRSIHLERAMLLANGDANESDRNCKLTFNEKREENGTAEWTNRSVDVMMEELDEKMLNR